MTVQRRRDGATLLAKPPSFMSCPKRQGPAENELGQSCLDGIPGDLWERTRGPNAGTSYLGGELEKVGLLEWGWWGVYTTPRQHQAHLLLSSLTCLSHSQLFSLRN